MQNVLPIEELVTTVDPLRPLTEAEPAAAPAPQTQKSWAVRILLEAAFVLVLWYLHGAALRYFTLSRDTYGIFWPRHGWLYLHVVAGTVALLAGPIQFWPGLKQRYPRLHRIVGIFYVASAGTGGVAAFYLAFHTDFGWMFGAGLSVMAAAWMISTGLATVAICRRMIPQHQEWMIRSYVLTFGFVLLRLTTDILEMSHIGTFPERLSFASWICWSVPLLITEMLLQGRKIFSRTIELELPTRVTRIFQ